MRQYRVDSTGYLRLVDRILANGVAPTRLLRQAGGAVADRAFAGRTGSVRGRCNLCRVTACAGPKTCWKERQFDYRPTVAVFSGCGSKGGCGWTAAEALARAGCHVLLASKCAPEDFPQDAIRGEALRIAQRPAGDFSGRLEIVVGDKALESPFFDGNVDSVIDALCGVDEVHDGLTPFERSCLALADGGRLSSAYRVAADVPTGIDADTGALSSRYFRADVTVSFMVYKQAIVEAAGMPWGTVHCDWLGIWPLDYLAGDESATPC